MSIYDKASLVLIPSGSKTSKVYSQVPTNGDGDFTFSRSTAATRVNASGNIEKETENLFTDSNDFGTASWNGSVTRTSGQTGYDGTSNAWLIQNAAASAYIRQNSNLSGVLTASIYAKAGNVNWMRFAVSNNPIVSIYFDLVNGVGYGASNLISHKVEDVGSGWHRYSVSFLANSMSGMQWYPADANNDLGEVGENIYIQDAQLEQGLVARDYIETTTTAIYGGITDNVPRLDYTDSSCPALLLEPQRTNSITGSEYFDGGSLINTAITAEYNTADTLSPEGLYNAAKLTAASNFPRYYDFPTIADNVNVTLSCFAKAGSASVFTIRAFNKNNETAVVNFDLSEGTAELSQYDELTPSFDIVDMGNDWYRCSITTNTGSGATAFQIRPISHAQGETSGWSGSNYIYAYGAQMEQDATYLTSYIPTYGSAVTRNADLCNKTSATSLIGQTEGTLYVEVDFEDSISDAIFMTISDATSANRLHIGYDNSSDWIYCNVKAANLQQALLTSASPTDGLKKIAVAYKQNDFVMYINGTQVAADTNANVPTTNRIDIGNYWSAGYEHPVKENLLFKTRLSNEELAALTTI